jgi:hypothetical protein
MSSMMRSATAGVLAIALATFSLVLDHCAASCEAHHEAVASTPSCHHASPAIPRIGRVPLPCGHDHTGTVVTTPNGAGTPLRTFNWTVAVLTAVVQPAGAAFDQTVPTHAPPGSPRTPDARSLPLRV